jgi:predicted AlkP superfamily pyrophosphatase or phosphodiesterase
MILPDYTGGSIINLLSAIQQAFGLTPGLYTPTRQVDVQRLADSRNIVLMVIDGLGYHFLRRQDANTTMCRHLAGRLTSVFPATTASAITSLMTGNGPQQHGVTGWFTYFKELGSVIAPLPFTARYGGGALREAGIDAHALFRPQSVFNGIDAQTHIVLPRRIVDSDYTLAHGASAKRHAYRSLGQCFERVRHILSSSNSRQYVYAYWPEFDSLAHAWGTGSEQAVAHFGELDAAFTRFVDALDGTQTTVLVTADHGFIDSEPEKMIRLEEHPALAETLMLPLCGEPRVAFCYVHPHKCEQFESYVLGELADYATLHNSADLVRQGFFGLGEPHPRLSERVGHYTLIMKENYVIKDWLLGEKRYVHIGVHGGVSEQEMHVPLIVVEA